MRKKWRLEAWYAFLQSWLMYYLSSFKELKVKVQIKGIHMVNNPTIDNRVWTKAWICLEGGGIEYCGVRDTSMCSFFLYVLGHQIQEVCHIQSYSRKHSSEFIQIKTMASKAHFLYEAQVSWLFKANRIIPLKISIHCYFSICNTGFIWWFGLWKCCQSLKYYLHMYKRRKQYKQLL